MTCAATYVDASGTSTDVTSATTFSIGGTGCSGATCQATLAPQEVVTGTYTDPSGTSWSGSSPSITVSPGPAVSLVLAPSAATIAAGTKQAYTATAKDVYGNPFPDTSNATFTASAGATCSGASCESSVAGTYTITGVDNSTSASGPAATLTVLPPVTSIALTPSPPIITVPGSASFTVTDSNGNDETAKTTLSISPSAGGSCSGAACTVTQPGTYTVTGTYQDPVTGLVSGTATLTANPPAATALALSPPSASIQAGTSASFSATDNNGYDVTSWTTFSISPSQGASCSGATCTATLSGTYTITGTDGSASGSAALTVVSGPATQLSFTTQPAGAAPGQAFSVALAELDQFGNLAASSVAPVSLAIGTNPSGGTLSGTTTVDAVGGVATLAGLSIDKGGIGYTLVASGPGLASVTSQAFTVLVPAVLTLSASPGTVWYGASATVSVHLSTGLANTPITIYFTPYGGSKKVLATGKVDASGDFSATSVRYLNATFVAQYAGDTTYGPSSSNTAAVLARARTKGAMLGWYGRTRSGIYLYHYSSSCPRAHRSCPTFKGVVEPNHSGKPLYFRFEMYRHGAWTTVVYSHSTILTSGWRAAALIYSNTAVRGVLLRARAEWPTAAGNLSSQSGWFVFEVTK